MNTPDSGLDNISKRIFVALLQQLENNQISGWRAVFAKTTLWYYQSPLALLPDFLPGFGYIDNFCLSQLALWLCATDPDTIDERDVYLFEIRCQQFLSESDRPILKTDSVQE